MKSGRVPPARRFAALPLAAELVIETLVPEGRGLGRLPDGRVALVDGVVPGDRIAVEGHSDRGTWVLVDRFRLLESSPERVEPRCPVARECGGCDWMMLSPRAQAEGKRALIEQALRRTAKLDREVESVHSSPLVDGYRGRVRLKVESGRIGFHERGSHELVEPAWCTVSAPGVNAALASVRAFARSHPGALDGFSWVEIRADSDERISLFFGRSAEGAAAGATEALSALRGDFIVAASADDAAVSESWQRYQLTEATFMLSPPGGFTQVNWEVNRALVARVCAEVKARGARSFLDAYAGSGNFSLPLLALGLTGLGVEVSPLMIRAAREAARRQGLPERAFEAGDAVQWAKRLGTRGARFDLVILDPPRAGVKHGLEQLARLCDRWLLMCSCNPVTLARDLKVLGELGFELESIAAFDMFPETHHVETLAWLRAPERRPALGAQSL